MNEPQRRRGYLCALVDLNPVSRIPLGPPVDTDQQLCASCLRLLEEAIRSLPEDNVHLHLCPQNTNQGMQERVSGTREPQVPIRLDVHVLMDEIEHETACWAESVAEALGSVLDTQRTRDSRPGVRLQRACSLLTNALSTLLELPEVEHASWAKGTPAVRHRTGIDGANVLIELHNRALQMSGKARRSYRLPEPCPRCEHDALQYEENSAIVTCAACREQYGGDEYRAMCLLGANAPTVVLPTDSSDPWPWPSDSQVDRARRIARSYRAALTVADPCRLREA